jgi:DnaJ-class molecular chaperone
MSREFAKMAHEAWQRGATEVRCAFCQGTGKDPFGIMSKLSSCCVCLGKGTVEVECPYETCAHCEGTGAIKRLTCTACGGKGVLSVLKGPTAVCPDCGGSGNTKSAPAMPCLRCGGRGKVLIEQATRTKRGGKE